VRQVRETLGRSSTGIGDGDPRLLVEPSAGGGSAWPSASRTSARTWRPSTGTRRWASAWTPATPGPAGTTWPPGGAAATLAALDAPSAGPVVADPRERLEGRVRLARDRHENVGAGTIGVDGFAALLRHPTAAGCRWW
jgi:deoxyribonuclease-4